MWPMCGIGKFLQVAALQRKFHFCIPFLGLARAASVPIATFWEYLFRIFGIVSLQCVVITHCLYAVQGRDTSVRDVSFKGHKIRCT